MVTILWRHKCSNFLMHKAFDIKCIYMLVIVYHENTEGKAPTLNVYIKYIYFLNAVIFVFGQAHSAFLVPKFPFSAPLALLSVAKLFVSAKLS